MQETTSCAFFKTCFNSVLAVTLDSRGNSGKHFGFICFWLIESAIDYYLQYIETKLLVFFDETEAKAVPKEPDPNIAILFI